MEILIASLLALQEIKDGTYTNEKLGVRLTVPKEWKIAKGEDETLCTISFGEDVEGDLEVDEETDETVEKAAELVESGLKEAEGLKKFTVAKDEKKGDRLQRHYVMDHKEVTVRWVCLYVRKDKAMFTLSLCCDEKHWKKLEADVAKIVDSLGFAEAAMENPWKGCGKGSWAKYKVTVGTGAAARMPPPPDYHTYVLIEQDAESYTIRIDRQTGGGALTEGKPEKVMLKREAAAANVEKGEETLKSEEKDGTWTLKCAWTKTKLDERRWIKVWTSDEVPGRLVKRIEGAGAAPGQEVVLVQFEKK